MTVIQRENLWKEYRLGVIGHGTLREDMGSWWAKLCGKDDPNAKIAPMLAGQEKQIEGERFWALRDINLEVRKGQILGIIGKNGAGKSTLLKILSRVTAPTKGSLKIKGRIASLLEVGTGFHPELTGRENIFMNGIILGMSKQEIKSKLDEIIDFSGVENFINTPVKRYSSGMYVRLAFAVAAHLEPEILIIDEVLAVGDADFQKKCLGKMDAVAHEGRTVLFVSHNMGMINQLCPVSVWLSAGTIHDYGASNKIITNYLSESVSDLSGGSVQITPDDRKYSQLTQFCTLNEAGEIRTNYDCDQFIILKLTYVIRHKVKGLYGYLQIMTTDHRVVMVSDSFDPGKNPLDNLEPGEHSISIKIPPRTLAPGTYYIYLNFTGPESQRENIDSPGIVGRFQLDDPLSKRGNRRNGFFSTLLEWEVNS
ncbi:MAG: ABC transporter ATP-binding protein [Candidatus Electrothrix sp. AR4]|nr:ABC transporter ATP-binding protein [Candidatus Electrothrix sp. AR4]